MCIWHLFRCWGGGQFAIPRIVSRGRENADLFPERKVDLVSIMWISNVLGGGVNFDYRRLVERKQLNLVYYDLLYTRVRHV